LLYVNADSVLKTVLDRVRADDSSSVRVVICDLSASPYVDLAGSRMLHGLQDELSLRGIAMRIVGARGRVRDLLRADGVAERAGGLDRISTLEGLLTDSADNNKIPDTKP
jgi:MFS superfamily sulfate permease-like transporter